MKIIFSDLDGTLLFRGESVLNKNIKNSIYKIIESGNIFAVSSGRTYIELKNFFKEFEEDIFFVCNDGSLCVFKEQSIFEKPMNKSMFTNFREYTAHGKYVTYIKSSRPNTIRSVMKQYRGHVMQIDDIFDIEENIYKISDFDKTVSCPLPIVYKNHEINEYIAADTDKKDAVSFIINMLGIKKENSFAFGDNINDLGMFDICGTSYASVTAKPAIKKSADKVTCNIDKDFINIINNK